MTWQGLNLCQVSHTFLTLNEIGFDGDERESNAVMLEGPRSEN